MASQNGKLIDAKVLSQQTVSLSNRVMYGDASPPHVSTSAANGSRVGSGVASGSKVGIDRGSIVGANGSREGLGLGVEVDPLSIGQSWEHFISA